MRAARDKEELEVRFSSLDLKSLPIRWATTTTHPCLAGLTYHLCPVTFGWLPALIVGPAAQFCTFVGLVDKQAASATSVVITMPVCFRPGVDGDQVTRRLLRCSRARYLHITLINS